MSIKNNSNHHKKKHVNNGFVNEFKAFLSRGSATDMAVGIVVGGVISSLINTFVKDVIMPPIGLLLGGVDFSNFFIVLKGADVYYPTLSAAQAAGATTVNIGIFINSLVSFTITMFGIFLFVRAANKVRDKHAGTRQCPYCKMLNISLAATKCPYCCSALIPKKEKKDLDVEKLVLKTVKNTTKKIGKTTKQLGETTKKIGKTTKSINKKITKTIKEIID